MSSVVKVLPETRSLPAVALCVMVVSAAAAATWLAWRPIDHLVAHSMSDDAFYYFQTARTIVDGGGVSVDGEVWANGFHPLWLIILLPIYAAGAGDETAIHIALTVSGVAVALSGIALYATARRLGVSQLASLIVTAAYLCHPVVLYMSVNGLETGVNLAAFVGMLYLFVRCWQEPTSRNEMIASAAAGIVVLSRTDYGITAFVVLIALVIRTHAGPASIARLAVPALAVTAPWFIWNAAVFHTPLQSSTGAIPYVIHQLFPSPDASSGEIVRHALTQLRDGAYDVMPYVYFTARVHQAHYAVAGVGLLIAAALALATLPGDRTPLRALGLLAIPACGLLGQLVVHTAVRWYFREWYVVAVFPLLALTLGLLLDMLWRTRAGIAASAAVIAVVAASIVLKSRTTYGDGWYGLQSDMLAAARWIDTETPPDARVAAFNSGIVGYFSHRTTVNLDGVMNPDAFEAIRERRVAEYTRERDIDYLADFPYYPFWFYRPFLGGELQTTEVARFDDVTTFQGPFVVYELRHDAAPPPSPADVIASAP